jgi:hypothetical protein
MKEYSTLQLEAWQLSRYTKAAPIENGEYLIRDALSAAYKRGRRDERLLSQMRQGDWEEEDIEYVRMLLEDGWEPFREGENDEHD